MANQQTALLHWLAKVLHQQSLTIQDLKPSKILYRLISKLPQIPAIEFVEPSPSMAGWQTNYINFKNIHQAIQSYYRSVLKTPLPIGLPPVNLLQISKGNDKEGLVSLLILGFVAAINSRQSQKFIEFIMTLDEQQQQQLMILIQQKKLIAFNQAQSTQMTENTQNSNEKEQDRGKIYELYFKIQSLTTENDSLTVSLMAEIEQKNKLKQQIKKLQQDGKKLKRELDEKTLYIQQKQIQQEQEESTKQVLSDSNEQVIHMLKKQLVTQQEEHLKYKKQMEDKVQTINQQLSLAKQKIAQLESEDFIGMSSNRKILHQDCVSINEHKNITQKLQMKMKLVEQKNTQLQREIIRGRYEHDELKRKLTKQQKQKQNIKAQFEKVSNNKGQMISQRDAERLKISILEAVKDRLKSNLTKAQNKELSHIEGK